MKKKLLIHKKQEKRIVKLALKKGLINQTQFDSLFWEYYSEAGRQKKKRKNGHRARLYYPELFFWSVDYWGEGNEYSIVRLIDEEVYYTINELNDKGEFNEPMKHLSRKGLINYLKALTPPASGIVERTK